LKNGNRWGKPQQVRDQQYDELEKAGHLQFSAAPEWNKTNNGEVMLKFNLDRQGVSLIRITLVDLYK
jgi:hypothetical protein